MLQTKTLKQNSIIRSVYYGVADKPIDGLLIGDSYANHCSGMIDEIAKATNLRITDYTMDACPPILSYANDLSATYAQRCIVRNEHIAQIIKKITTNIYYSLLTGHTTVKPILT